MFSSLPPSSRFDDVFKERVMIRIFVIPGHYRFSTTEVLDSGNHLPCDKFHCIEGVSFSSLFILFPYSFDTSKGVEGGKY
jgi:hypothetical protein